MQEQILKQTVRPYADTEIHGTQAFDDLQEEDQNTIKEILLTICLAGGYEYITNIWIFNNDKSVAAEPFQSGNNSAMRHYYLFPGKYFIRVEINAQVEDNEVVLIADTTYFIGDRRPGLQRLNAPKLYTSALLKGAAVFETSQQYYLNAAVTISKKSTYEQPVTGKIKSGIFIFMRYPNAEIYREVNKGKNYWKNFSLKNSKGKIICKFPDHTITDQTDNVAPAANKALGFLGFTGELPPGLYFLDFKGKDKRQIPIYIYQGWFTQFFMTVATEPLFGTIRIFLSKHKRFDPSNKYHLFIDICLNKIQNEDYEIDQDLLYNIAYGKYDSPMLGLLGAYIYLKSKETKNDHLFRQIINNLQNKILVNSKDAPDIWALNLLSYEHFNETFTAETRAYIAGTPMLRIAYDTIKKAGVKYKWLIPKGSLNDLIVEKQVVDSPYNTFSPIDLKTVKNNSTFTLISEVEKARDSFFTPETFSTLETRNTGNQNVFTLKNALDINDIGIGDNLPVSFAIPKRVLVSKSINSPKKDYYASLLANPKKLGWLGFSIVNEIADNTEISSEAIADKLIVPINTIERIREQYQV